jgi:hypothetical protein
MGRMVPYIVENKIHVPNHQPDYFNHIRMAYGIPGISDPILGAMGVWASKAQRASL